MKHFPPYLTLWFIAMTLMSVFTPVTLTISLMVFGVVVAIFLLFNYKHLSNAKR